MLQINWLHWKIRQLEPVAYYDRPENELSFILNQAREEISIMNSLPSDYCIGKKLIRISILLYLFPFQPIKRIRISKLTNISVFRLKT